MVRDSVRGTRWLLGLALMLASLSLAACNTMEGAGKDVQKGGQAIEEAAKDVKSKL